VKIPKPFFVMINVIMRLLLRSPLHFVASRSLMLITFTGRNSGRQFTTPVRYFRDGETVRSFTSVEGQWWRNLRGGADVVLSIEGRDAPYHATAVENDPEEVKKRLRHYLGLFPQDAAYHEIRLNRDKSPVSEDLEKASRSAILVEAKPIR
jgi:hypothetical protein